MHLKHLLSPRLASALLGVTLGALACACGPTAAIAPTPVPVDPFTVVRTTSQAAYLSGKAHLDRGELQQALIDLDTARTNDPDNRPEIEQALAQTISQLALQTPTAEPTSIPRAIVVPTVPAARPATAVTPAPATTALAVAAVTGPTSVAVAAPTSVAVAGPTSIDAAAPTSVAVARPTSVAVAGPTFGAASAATPGAAPQAGKPAGLVAWRDPQGRFTLSAPADWARAPSPLSLFGTSAVQFRDPSVQAELDVAVDGASKAVSPELFAATMELAMQQQVPGYAAEQTLPGSTAGNPSVRRVYTFSQRDAAGTESQARGFQVVVVKGSTPYLISGSAPADQFATFSPTFDQMVETFGFS